MASLRDILRPRPGDDGVTFAPVEKADKPRALALLLTGSPRVDESVEAFVDLTREQSLSTDLLWTANRSGRPVAAALVIPCPGRTAMLFTSPVDEDSARPGTKSGFLPGAVSGLAGFACGQLDPAEVQLVQSLLEPAQAAQRRALESAGFARLADLTYMTRPAPAGPPGPTPLRLDAGLGMVHYTRGRRKLFGEAVLASYEQTRDCPGLLGVRDIGDIIDGHMAAGRFRADLWHVVVADGDTPAAVMLLNLIPQRDALELVYLGVSPAWRGRGLARRLLEHGVGLAQKHRANEVILAVDAANEPALSLYKSLRFAPTARKVAMMFTLP